MNPIFTQLFFPHYWRYNIVSGLAIVAECGYSDDLRVKDAIQLIEAKNLPDGGYPSEKKFYHTGKASTSGKSLINWGGVSKKKSNEWVTLEVLSTLKLFKTVKL